MFQHTFRKYENSSPKRYNSPKRYTPILTAALFTIAKPWKQPKCPLTNEQLEKCGIYTHRNIAQP